MTEVNNQSTSLSMSKIMAEANEAMGKLTMLGVAEGNLSEGLTNTQTQVAQKYQGYIEEANEKNALLTKFSIGAAVTVAVAGAASGVGSGVYGNQITHSLVQDGMEAVSLTAEGGLSVGQGVTGVAHGKAEAKEEISSATIQVTGTNSGSKSSSTGDIIDAVSSGKGSITAMVKNEGQASTYQG